MFNFDYIIKKYIKEHNLKWPKLRDQLYRSLWISKIKCIT